MKKTYFLVLISVLLSSCSYRYQDDFPEPCTQGWNQKIEQEVKLVNATTGLPWVGSDAWQHALDERLQISTQTGYNIGELEWCHLVHQELIGL